MSSSEEEKKEEELSVSTSSGSSDDDEEEEAVVEDPLQLDPPTFALPAGDDIELWSIRMPISVDHEALNGMKFSVDKKNMGSLKSSKGEKYGVVLGDTFESDSFRLLVEDGDFLVPSDVTFTKHLNIIHADAVNVVKQTDLAPGIDRAPKPVDPVRKAYSVVPQKSGLKRRWMPPGLPPTEDVSRTEKAKKLITGLSIIHRSNAQKSNREVVEMEDASPAPTSKRRRKKEESEENDEQNGSVKIEAEDEKARKAAKKAKKEAKKAKKEKRKSKD